MEDMKVDHRINAGLTFYISIGQSIKDQNTTRYGEIVKNRTYNCLQQESSLNPLMYCLAFGERQTVNIAYTVLDQHTRQKSFGYWK